MSRGIGKRQRELLAVLGEEHQPLSVAELAERLFGTPTESQLRTVRDSLRSLIERGHVVRHGDSRPYAADYVYSIAKTADETTEREMATAQMVQYGVEQIREVTAESEAERRVRVTVASVVAMTPKDRLAVLRGLHDALPSEWTSVTNT